MNKRWVVSKTNRAFLEYLAKKTSISTTCAQILVNRGLKDTESIRDFLSPSIEKMHDPFLAPDMEKAVERINTAITRGDSALVYGDYDADGLTATAIIVSTLRKLGLKTSYYIPNRLTEGYGLKREWVNKAKKLGIDLLITADCGISAGEAVSTAVSHGIDVIITDHHEPPEKLPGALAVINPHRKDSGYPFKGLAGAGVAYKLAQALTHGDGLEDLLGLAAIGTIADSVPLTGENRIMATYGLMALNRGRHAPWISALKETSGTGKKEFSADLLSYTLIPRINAAGRLGDADMVVELFLTQDAVRARAISSFLEAQNKKRQKIEESVCKSALNMIGTGQPDNAIVLHSHDWHPGVIGIVASRLVEKFYRPAFLFSVTGAVAKGSARSIPQFHLFKGIAECAELLIDFGGHSQAAGLTLRMDEISVFKERINSIIGKELGTGDITPTVEIDAGIELSEVNPALIREIRLMEPFGNSNQEPVFGVKKVEVVNPRVVGNNHLKMRLKKDSVSLDTIGFSMSHYLEKIEAASMVDIAFVPCINEWNGNRVIQLNLKDLKPSM